MRWYQIGHIGKREEMRFRIEREDGFIPSRGFGISTSGGCMGTEYGDPRTKMTRNISVQLWWKWTLMICWKLQ